MPTQEDINAANLELQMANDNYATLANRYNQFQNVFTAYKNATPEKQALAATALDNALKAFEELKLNMYAAEDRIQQAQNRVNDYNEIIANQAVQQTTQSRPIVKRQYPNNYFWWEWWKNESWTLISPDGVTKVYPDWSISFWEPEPVTQGEPVVTENVWPQWTQTLLIPGQWIVTMQDWNVINTQTWGNLNTFWPLTLKWYKGWSWTLVPYTWGDIPLTLKTYPWYKGWRWTLNTYTWWAMWTWGTAWINNINTNTTLWWGSTNTGRVVPVTTVSNMYSYPGALGAGLKNRISWQTNSVQAWPFVLK